MYLFKLFIKFIWIFLVLRKEKLIDDEDDGDDDDDDDLDYVCQSE